MAQPRSVIALQRATIAVAAAGVVAALVVGFGGTLISAAAEAAVSAGGGYGAGGRGDAAVSELAATAPVAAPAPQVETIATPTASTVVPPGEALGGQLQGIVAPKAAAPVVEPAVVVAAGPAVVPDPGTVEAIIYEVFGQHGRDAVAVARCESGLNPGSVSRGGGNWGLFQINKAHRGRVAAMGYQWEDLLDARVNALVAKSIFDEQGWGPWACRRAI